MGFGEEYYNGYGMTSDMWSVAEYSLRNQPKKELTEEEKEEIRKQDEQRDRWMHPIKYSPYRNDIEKFQTALEEISRNDEKWKKHNPYSSVDPQFNPEDNTISVAVTLKKAEFNSKGKKSYTYSYPRVRIDFSKRPYKISVDEWGWDKCPALRHMAGMFKKALIQAGLITPK